MKSSTLDYDQVLSFTGLSETTVKAKGQKAIIKKLDSMGLNHIVVQGRGKKANFSFIIPTNFWMMTMVPIKYSAVSVDVMKLLMEGNVRIINGRELYLFSKEVLSVISSKYDVNYDAVKQTYTRMKHYLTEHDLLYRTNQKSHRITIDGKWIAGKRAIDISDGIKSNWRKMFNRLKRDLVTESKEIQAECNWLRNYIIRVNQADAYKVIRFSTATHNLLRDIRWAENAFYTGTNLAQIKEEIAVRHKKYKANKKKSVELLKAMNAKEEFDWDEWLED